MEEVLDSQRRLQCWLSYSLRRLVKCRKGLSVELCATLADSGTSVVVVDGSAKVLRALGSRSKANELVQFFKCCFEAEDEGVQVTTVAVLVLGLASVVDNWFAGSGKQMTVQTEDVEAFHRCDATETSKDHHQLRTGSSRQVLPHKATKT